ARPGRAATTGPADRSRAVRRPQLRRARCRGEPARPEKPGPVRAVAVHADRQRSSRACAAAGPRLDWEGELAFVLGGCLRDATVEQAQAAILGYLCFNDLTARGYQRAGNQWTLGKN